MVARVGSSFVATPGKKVGSPSSKLQQLGFPPQISSPEQQHSSFELEFLPLEPQRWDCKPHPSLEADYLSSKQLSSSGVNLSSELKCVKFEALATRFWLSR